MVLGNHGAEMGGTDAEIVHIAQHVIILVGRRTEVLVAIAVRVAQTAGEKLVAAARKGRHARVRGGARAERQAAAVSHVCVWTRELHARIVRGERQLGWRWTVPGPAIRWPRGVVGEAEGGRAVEQRGCSRGWTGLSRARLSGVRRVAGRGRARVGVQRREGEAAACRRRGSLVTHGDGRRV